MAMSRLPRLALGAVTTAVLSLTGCDKLRQDGADWARAALERNDQISVVAFDANSRTFTVKVRQTGELRVVHADQVIGTLPGIASKVTDATAGTAAIERTPVNGAVEPVGTQSPATEPAPANAAGAEPEAGGTGVITDPVTGSVLAANTEPHDTVATSGNDHAIIAAGPGYSIKSGSGVARSTSRRGARDSETAVPARGVSLERRAEPMICQGQRVLRIDGRNLEFDGDAISVEEGCEIYISNSHIIAHGIGVSARGANVHIQNSIIEGDVGSVSASNGAQVYTQTSTFKGLSRRLDTAADDLAALGRRVRGGADQVSPSSKLV